MTAVTADGEELVPAVERSLGRIDRARHLNAFACVNRRARGDGPVVAVKDNISVADLPMRAGSVLTDDRPCRRDAVVVASLRRSGYAVIGKTSMHELACGATGDNPSFGNVINPCGADRIPGGSSSGSAVAVAAGLCDAALGTDTGGSVRLPAALCGVVGYKPRRQVLSRRGVLILSRSLDAVGVLAPDVATAMTTAVAMGAPGPRAGARDASPAPRLAVPWAWMEGVDDAVAHAFEAIAGHLPDAALPPREDGAAPAAIVSLAEAARDHRRELEAPPGMLGEDVRELLERGRGTGRAAYMAARHRMLQFRRKTRVALAAFDAVVLPTVPCVAPTRGVDATAARARLTGWVRPFNASDSPAISLPLRTGGLPVGIQLVANEEVAALRAALWLERRLRGLDV